MTDSPPSDAVEGTIALVGDADALLLEISVGDSSVRVPVEALAPALAHPVAFTTVLEALVASVHADPLGTPVEVIEGLERVLAASEESLRGVREALQDGA